MNVWKMKCKCEENVVCLENVVKIKCWKMCCECGKNLGKFGVNFEKIWCECGKNLWFVWKMWLKCKKMCCEYGKNLA